VPVPQRMPVAVDEKRIAWVTSSNGASKINLLTPQTGVIKTLNVSLAGITQLSIVGPHLFTISARGDQSMHLHQVSIGDGTLSYLSLLTPQWAAISFGQSIKDRLTLIDNAEGRFREDATSVPYTPGSWKRIESPIIDITRNLNNSKMGPKFSLNLIIQHWFTKAGNHVFVTRHRESMKGQYAIETDSNGRQLEQFLLENWGSKIGEAGDFSRHSFTTYTGIGSLQYSGDLVGYFDLL